MDLETSSEVGQHMGRCCWSDREEVHIEEHCCWIGHEERLACGGSFDEARGSSRAGRESCDR